MSCICNTDAMRRSNKDSKRAKSAAEAIAGKCLAMRVKLLHRRVISLFDDRLRPFGVTAGQVNLLVEIINRGSTSAGALARAMAMDKSTFSRNAELLGKKGWITVAPAGSRNTKMLEVTPEGNSLLADVFPHWQKAQKAANDLLGIQDANALREIGNAVYTQSATKSV